MLDWKLASKNILSNYGMFIAKMFVGLLALPICLNAFGVEIYGLYLICFGLSSSMATFDFGGSKSVFRYVVEHNSDKNETKFTEALSVGITFNILSSFLITVALLLLGYYSNNLFSLTKATESISFPLFALAAINSAILTFGTIPVNILNGNNNFHSRNLVQIIPLSATLILLTYLSFNKGFSVINFSLLMVCISTLSLALDLLLVRRKKLLQGIPIKLKLNNTIFRSTNIVYNYRLFLLSLVGFLAIQADRLIIASFFSVASVAIYAIITKPYFLLKGLLATSYPVIQPQLSKYNMQQNREDFNDFTSRLIRSSFVLFLSGISFISIFFEEALWIWLRSADYNNHTVWGVLMLLGLGITVLYSPFYRTLFYTDKVKNILNFSFISVSINLLISIILTSYIGFQGVIIGTTTQIILEFFYFNHLAKNELAVNLKMIYTKRLVVATLSIILFSIIIYILKMWYGGSPLILTLIALFTICMLATIIFYFLRVEKIHLLFQRKKEISFQ